MKKAIDSKRIRLGIVGCGSSRELYREITHFPHMWTLVGLADPDEENLAVASKLWQCDLTSNSAETLLEKCRPDLLLVCTPPETHIGIILAAAERKIHTLVQKPLARTVDEVGQIQSACRANHVAMRVSFYRRFVQAFQDAAGTVTALGRGGTLRVTWRSSSGLRRRSSKQWKERMSTLGGVLVDLGSHVIDTAHWWLGDFRGGSLAMTVGRYGDVENTAAVLLHHNFGASTLCYLSNIERDACEIYEYTNPNGGLTLVQTEAGFPGRWRLDTWRSDSMMFESKIFEHPERSPFIEELADFIASLDAPTIDADDRGARVVEVTTCLYHSSLEQVAWSRVPTDFSLQNAFRTAKMQSAHVRGSDSHET